MVKLFNIETNDFDNFILQERQKENDFFIGLVRGKKMKSEQDLFNEFSAVFQFPNYFGENWNAFYDCMTDLSWLKEKKFIIAISELNLVLNCLEKDKSEIRQLFVNKLKSIMSYWNNPFQPHEEFGHDSVEFHIYIQSSEPIDKDFIDLTRI